MENDERNRKWSKEIRDKAPLIPSPRQFIPGLHTRANQRPDRVRAEDEGIKEMYIKIIMKIAVALTFISLVQSAAIPSADMPADNLNLDVSETPDQISISDIIPDWLVQFKDFRIQGMITVII